MFYLFYFWILCAVFNLIYYLKFIVKNQNNKLYDEFIIPSLNKPYVGVAEADEVGFIIFVSTLFAPIILFILLCLIIVNFLGVFGIKILKYLFLSRWE